MKAARKIFNDLMQEDLTGKGIIDKSALKSIDIGSIGELLPQSKSILKLKDNRRQTWSPSEDQMILDLIQKYGKNWAQISRMIGGARSGRQIRDRYLNILNPKINKKQWTVQEDELLLKLYQQHGRKWVQIAKYIPGRSEVMVKNRFYSKFSEYLDNSMNNIDTNDTTSQENGHAEDKGHDSPLLQYKDTVILKQPELKPITQGIVCKVEEEKPVTQSNLHQKATDVGGMEMEEEEGTNNIVVKQEEVKQPEMKDESDKILEKIELHLQILEGVLKSGRSTVNLLKCISSISDKMSTQEIGNSPAMKTKCLSLNQNVQAAIPGLLSSFTTSASECQELLQKFIYNESSA